MNRTIYSGLAALGLTAGLGPQPTLAMVGVSVQPTNQVVLVGSNAVFVSQTTTTAGEIVTGYTWLMSTNGQPPFAIIAGATSATCTLTNVQTTNAGSYFARVTYTSGTNTGLTTPSQPAMVIVHDQARITSQPQGGFIRITGSNVSFSVTAVGLAPLSYQWRHNGTNLVNDARISGATGSNLMLIDLAVTDSGNYDVVVTNLYAAVTSQVATVSVFAPPVIVGQPTNSTVIVGSNAVFSVMLSGSPPLSFRWRTNGTPLNGGGRISGATTDTLVISGVITNDAVGYNVIITNVVGAATSTVATLTVLVPPTITSATSANGRQGTNFSFTVTATGTRPITFGAVGLPPALTLVPTNGVISGVPQVSGVVNVTLFATNAAMTTTGQLVLSLGSGAPGIRSALTANGKQGQSFSYTILASNNPAVFSATGLPPGLNFNPTTGRITGVPIVSGTFPVTIGAANVYGADSRVLTLKLASAVPFITSALTASGTENQSGFTYTIQASNAPTQFGASGLPLGLTVNPTNGVISGAPLYGGTNSVVIWAANAWGTGSTNLVLQVAYETVTNLVIDGVANVWSVPYLLDFSFSLRNGTDPGLSGPVVRPATSLEVVCMEGFLDSNGNLVSTPIPSETGFVVEKGAKKQLRSFLVLDYSYSMFASPGAIDAMQSAAELLINEEPVHALFGVYEFHADYVDPNLVTTNGFTADKAALAQAIEGIEDTYVLGDYAGTRAWDAIYAALGQFPSTTNRDELRYLIAMTDGNDDSSLLNTNAAPLDVIVSLAQSNQVRIFCVAYGSDVNTAALQQLTSQTGGRYYLAATTADLALQFQNIVKDMDGQYILRWATLKRAPQPFQPSFLVTVDGVTATNNGAATILTITNVVYDTNDPPVAIDTNYVYTNVLSLPYNPPDWAGNVKAGALRVVADADAGPQTIRLRASYTPRYVRQILFNYRANYPGAVTLDSTATNELLYGWSLAQTNDGTGGQWLAITSPNPTNLLTSLKYGAMGDLVTFQFQYPESVTATQAFSVLTVNNSIYTNMLPSGQSFSFENATNFVTLYPPPPPHGTPIPWLLAYGFTNDFVTAELADPNGNGLPVWQDYLAGLNPLDPNSTFGIQSLLAQPGQPPLITFPTVATRTYRVDTCSVLGSWMTLLDNISGTGSPVTVVDLRNLTGVNAVFYRVVVY